MTMTLEDMRARVKSNETRVYTAYKTKHRHVRLDAIRVGRSGEVVEALVLTSKGVPHRKHWMRFSLAEWDALPLAAPVEPART